MNLNIPRLLLGTELHVAWAAGAGQGVGSHRPHKTFTDEFSTENDDI